MPPPERILPILRRAATLARATPGRSGYLVRLQDCTEVLVAGDLHGHVANFDAIAGRLNDVILLDNGDAVHSVAVFHCVHQEQVHNIQMVLHDDGVDLCLVSSEPDRPSMEARIRGRLGQVHPLLANVRFKYLEDLETNRAGKRRWFVDHRTHITCAASQAS